MRRQPYVVILSHDTFVSALASARATLRSVRRALIVVGKAPVAGRTKTRLVPPLTAEQAAALSRGFLLDAISLGLSLQWERVTLVHPGGSSEVLQELVSANVHLLEQRGEGLSAALAFAFEHHFAAGFESAVLIGSDNPTLPAELLIEAEHALQTDCDLVLGPSVDGGYYLIAMRQPRPALFQNIDWSTPRVYGQTLERARQLGLRVRAVKEWYDVDEPADLDRLLHELATSPGSTAPHTRAALDDLHVQAGGTSSVGLRPDRSAYSPATRSPTARPRPLRARMTTEPPNPPPVIRAP